MFELLQKYFRPLQAFDFLGRPELRAFLAALTAFLVVLFFGRFFIRWVKKTNILEHSVKGDSKRLDELHSHKSATPTLGGVILFTGAFASALLWMRWDQRELYVFCAYGSSLAILGFLDDLKKLKTKKRGLSAKAKLRIQLLLSALVGAYLTIFPIHAALPQGGGEGGTSLFIPFFKLSGVPLGAGFAVLVVLVTTGASNAVNLTDGLDGLAAGTSAIVAAALTAVAFLSGRPESAAILNIPSVERGLEVGIFLAALAGAGVGFLWFNCHPAQIFMGDTGALPLGGVIGLAAVLLKQEILLLIAGGVLVAEALSVILQVLSFKIRRKRIFLIAPLHHHFQFKGWSETKITVRFWIVGALLALSSLATLKML